MGVRIKLDYRALDKVSKALRKPARAAMEALRTDVASAQVMPFDTGHMQNNQTFVSEIPQRDGALVRLETDTPYARRLYYHPEYHFQTVNNPSAGGLWLEDWVSGDKKDFLLDTYAQLLRREL